MKAADKYVEFHQFEPRSTGAFVKGFSIPRRAELAGRGLYVLYRSDKLNPETGADEGVIDYIHEHKDGVKVYLTEEDDAGPLRRVPQFITKARELTLLGICLGFAYEDEDGQEVIAEPTAKSCELYTIPSGKALVVVEGKRRVVSLIWGGKLGVEARGIVG